MKTPRELLLERHTPAAAQLKIRALDLAAEARGTPAARCHSEAPRNRVAAIWSECVRPWRTAWIGIVAAWVAIIAVEFSVRPANEVAAGHTPPPTSDVEMLLREQRQLLARLLDADAPANVAEPKSPGPRGDRGRAGRIRDAGASNPVPANKSSFSRVA